MNDPHDNAQTDAEMLQRYQADPSGARYPDPHYDEDDTCQCPDHIAMRGSVQPAPLLQKFLAAQGRAAGLPQVLEPTEDNSEHQATIRASMSDLEVANEIIRVLGYERLIEFMEILSDRFNNAVILRLEEGEPVYGWPETDPQDDYYDDANQPPAERYGYRD